MKNLTFLIILLLTVDLSGQNLVTYQVPGGYQYSAHNDDFTVLVRTPGGEWQDLFEYEVEVDMDTKSKASMVYFDFEGRVDVQVRKNDGLIHQAKIRPASKGIEPVVEGETISFSLSEPTKISLEINGNRLNNLHVFASAVETEKPDPEDPDVIYFGPGVHSPDDQPGDVYNIPSGKTVYVDGGAIINAKFLVNKAENVKILGRGIIMQPERGVEIRHSSNVTVDGLIFINPRHYTIYGGESDDLTIRNIKSFSSQGWSDGIDLMACSDVVIDDVFMRNSDDCIAIYAHRWDFFGSVRNYEIKNSTLWADIAHPTNIGTHGNATHSGDTIENITFRNLDILEHDEDDRNYQGVLAITGSDKNLIRNITYEDIRIDNIQEGQIFNFRVVFNERYSHAPGRNVENITLKDITYTGTTPNPSIIHGYSEGEQVENVSIENLRINGKLILKPEEGNIRIGEYAENVEFKR